MKKYIIYCLGLGMVLMNCNSKNSEPDPGVNQNPGTTTPAGEYNLTVAFPNLKFSNPIELTAPSDNTDRIFTVAQRGIIYVFPNKQDVQNASVFLDLSAKVTFGGERGLLGLAFHPNYKANGYFYVNYTRGNPLETVISRFKVSASNPNEADPNSELVLLRYNQPYDNHNGGKVAFGNDGCLYIAAGDGGSGGDPHGNGQNRKVLLGKILRIDVNTPSAGMSYSIPPDNPFINNTSGYRQEIFAYGMRNPWRFSFDRQTGTLWAGDVGQNRIEEVDIIEKGGNYGWNIMEATECFNTTNCDKTGLTEPVWSYGRSEGISVTGGYVCYDKSLTGLTGKYIYGDYGSGKIWALTYSGKKAVKNELIATLSDGLSSFGEDSNNNLYILAYNGGKIYKLVPKPN
jgi:glucose/arabinose dehydrogenase